MSLLLQNADVFYRGVEQRQDLRIRDGRIRDIALHLIPGQHDEVIDLTGKTIIPGVIDMHVHFRVPGGEPKEDWKTGSAAAARGGITAVCDMPNTNPPTTTRDLFKQKIGFAHQDSRVNYGIYFGAGPDNREEQKKLSLSVPIKCYVGPTTGSLLVDEQAVLEDIFAATDHLFLIHAEDKSEIDRQTKLYEGQNDPAIHSRIRTPEVAVIAIRRVLDLVRKYRRRTHFCHISSSAELELINQARDEGLPVTCEVTPHNLFLDESDYASLGTRAKMNPPLRPRDEREALFQSLVKGEIDAVATDHAPHTREEKDQNYWLAPAGVPGVETMLPLLLDQVHSGTLSLVRLIGITSRAPARILGFAHTPSIELGATANLTVIDLNLKKQVTDKDIVSKCGWSPFAGRELTGWPILTLVNGQVAYSEQPRQIRSHGSPLWDL